MSLEQGLVGHWTMDAADTSGGISYDSSAYDNHGTLTNGPTTGQSGQVNESILFDATNSEYIDITVADTQSFTLAAWVNQNTLGTGSSPSGIIEMTDGQGSFNDMRSIRADSDGSFTALIRGNGADDLLINGGSSTTGEWVHVALTFDGTNAELYVDNVSVGTTSGTDVGTISTSFESIGRTADPNYFDGRIDDVRYYDRALSSREISNLYNLRTDRTFNVQPLLPVSKKLIQPGEVYQVTGSENWHNGINLQENAAVQLEETESITIPETDRV